MTKRAAVGHDDILRALKACKRAGYEKGRVHINLREQTIDIMIGEDAPTPVPFDNPWDEEFKKTEGEAMLARVKARLAARRDLNPKKPVK